MSSMPQPPSGRGGEASTEQIVLGVDTHQDVHVAAVLTVAGTVLGSRSFPTTDREGRRRASGDAAHVQKAKASAVKSRTQAINQLKAIVMRAEPALRESLAGLSTSRLIRRCAELATSAVSDITAAAYTPRLLARRIYQHRGITPLA